MEVGAADWQGKEEQPMPATITPRGSTVPDSNRLRAGLPGRSLLRILVGTLMLTGHQPTSFACQVGHVFCRQPPCQPHVCHARVPACKGCSQPRDLPSTVQQRTTLHTSMYLSRAELSSAVRCM